MIKQSLSITLSAAALLGFGACEREKSGDAGNGEAVEAAKVAKPETTPEAGEGKISDELKKRIDEAEAQFARLEQRVTDAKQRIEAKGGEARTGLDESLEKAKVEVQKKLEAARKASVENARAAVDDVDKALEELKKELDKHDKT